MPQRLPNAETMALVSFGVHATSNEEHIVQGLHLGMWECKPSACPNSGSGLGPLASTISWTAMTEQRKGTLLTATVCRRAAWAVVTYTYNTQQTDRQYIRTFSCPHRGSEDKYTQSAGVTVEVVESAGLFQTACNISLVHGAGWTCCSKLLQPARLDLLGSAVRRGGDGRLQYG